VPMALPGVAWGFGRVALATNTVLSRKIPWGAPSGWCGGLSSCASFPEWSVSRSC